MKTKLNLPNNNNLLEENKELKKLIKLIYNAYEAKEKQVKANENLIKTLENIIKIHEKLEKCIAETLAKNDIHYVSINDEEFKEYQKKKLEN
ncbi:hypothetical protein SDC9_21207 [bioreactor metagenome]|uniref:Uncharacterized protein n=1 Tax=bioreactor metagenome TaxID=1076179 RepID=A0A644U957_9ZZZZ|nr:hypothetical protein [Methanobrevibacter sp.]MEA4957967.1 hypothetical protein [Methanobrevibacter sp.]